MKLMEKVWGSLGLFEPVEAEAEQPKEEEAEHKLRKSSISSNNSSVNNNNVISLSSLQAKSENRDSKQVKVVVVEPVCFDDAQHIADHLKARKPVVLNLESTEPEIAKRMVDFVSGTTYALSGTIQKVGNNIFLCAPSNVDVTYSSRDEDLEHVLPWGNSRA